jgi:hypothetical protein
METEKYSPFNWTYTVYGYLHNEPLTFFKDLWRNIKYAWQRVFRGWDDTVTWSVDYWLNNIMPDILRKLKADKHGIPGEMFPDQMNITKEDDIAAEIKWNAIMDDMIAGFEAARELSEISPAWDELMDEFDKRYSEEDKLAWMTNNETYREKWNALEEELDFRAKDQKWTNDLEAKFHKGMLLFHRYYFNLWD